MVNIETYPSYFYHHLNQWHKHHTSSILEQFQQHRVLILANIEILRPSMKKFVKVMGPKFTPPDASFSSFSSPSFFSNFSNLSSSTDFSSATLAFFVKTSSLGSSSSSEITFLWTRQRFQLPCLRWRRRLCWDQRFRARFLLHLVQTVY